MATSCHGRQRIERTARRRWFAGALLCAVSLVVLPVAVAWACAPQSASLAFDRDSYKAADAVGVMGGGFSPSTPVALTLQPPSGPAQAVDARAQTNSQGYFETSFALPPDAAPGDYVLQATTNTTTARDTFKVMAAQSEVVPTPLTPPPPPPPASPGPATPADQPSPNTTAARKRAVAKCKKRHRVRAGMSATTKRKLARKRTACIRSVKKKYP